MNILYPTELNLWLSDTSRCTFREVLISHSLPTSLAGIVDEHDLHEQVSGRAVDDTVNSPQQGAPRLIVKHDDNAGVGQVVLVHLGLAADRTTRRKKN